MYSTLCADIPKDPDLPDRAYELECLKLVLNGKIYDRLMYDFHQERQNPDGTGEYVPICKRKPSVRYNPCRLTVLDSVELLFGEGRFPKIDCENADLRKVLGDIITECRLNAVMVDAAKRGSIGSVAIRMRVLLQRLYFDVMDTCYLTPEWRPDAPEELLRVTERRKVSGQSLRDRGYEVSQSDMRAMFWFVRTWTDQGEEWLVPTKVVDGEMPSRIDRKRSSVHRLGFVPMVWIKNLSGGDEIDGACTFRPAVETQIEIEYQLSQCGRGLKYSSDPTLMIKEPAMSEGQLVRSASSALVVSSEGDAKMLEINGTAAAAVIEYVETLREYALESIKGNRAKPDTMHSEQSGKALEMLYQPLISLVEELRISYGSDGLVNVLKMAVRASSVYPLKVQGKPIGRLPDEPIALKWRWFFSPTYADQVQHATALGLAVEGGFMSPQAAVEAWAPTVDIEAVESEMGLIEDHQKQKQQNELQLKAFSPRPSGPGANA